MKLQNFAYRSGVVLLLITLASLLTGCCGELPPEVQREIDNLWEQTWQEVERQVRDRWEQAKQELQREIDNLWQQAKARLAPLWCRLLGLRTWVRLHLAVFAPTTSHPKVDVGTYPFESETWTRTRKVIIFLAGLTSELHCKGGGCASRDCVNPAGVTLFLDIKHGLATERGYHPSRDFLDYSYAGGCVDENGSWHPYPYFSEHTWNRVEDDLDDLDWLVKQYRQKDPNTTFILVGHSKGGMIAFEYARWAIQSSDYEPGTIAMVVTLDSPLHGVPASAIQEWWFPFVIEDIFGVGGLGTPLTHQLTEWYDQGPDRYVENWQTESKMYQNEIMVVTLGSYDDLLMCPNETQVVVTASHSECRSLGNDVNALDSGHSRIKTDPDIIKLIGTLIGDQNPPWNTGQ